MGKKYKLGLYIVVVAVIVIAVGAYLVKREKNKEIEECDTCRLNSNIENKIPTPKTQSPTSTQTPTEPKYKNDDYGFEIDLTSVWQDSQIEEEDATGAIKKIVFYFKTQDKAFSNSDYKAPALSIYIYNKENWEKMDPNTRSSNEITKSEKYAFSYSIWETTPQDLENITEKELADVIKTFKLTD